jgi:hypothetical protein
MVAERRIDYGKRQDARPLNASSIPLRQSGWLGDSAAPLVNAR